MADHRTPFYRDVEGDIESRQMPCQKVAKRRPPARTVTALLVFAFCFFVAWLFVASHASPPEHLAVSQVSQNTPIEMADTVLSLKEENSLPSVQMSSIWNLQVASFQFFQNLAFHFYVNNHFARRLQWNDMINCVEAYVRLFTRVSTGISSSSSSSSSSSPSSSVVHPCLQNFLEWQAVVSQRAEPFKSDWFNDTFFDATVSAFGCQSPSVKISEKLKDASSGLSESAVLSLSALSLHLPEQGLDQQIPFLSFRLQSDFTESRRLRIFSTFDDATRLWLELFTACQRVSSSFDLDDEKDVIDNFRQMFTMYVKMFPCGNCNSQFLDTITGNFLKRGFAELRIRMTGSSEFSIPTFALKQISCSSGWSNRPAFPSSFPLFPIQPFLIDSSAKQLLPFAEKQITVVLDIDETLMYTRRGPVLARPYLAEFLQGLFDLGCEVILWTAAEQHWAVNALTSAGINVNKFHFTIYRDPRWWAPHPASYTKDLRRLGRDMNYVIILENSPSSVWMNKNNALMIPDYFRTNLLDAALKESLDLIADLVAKKDSTTVPKYFASSGLLNVRCTSHIYDRTEDYAFPLYGFGDFTN